MATLTVAVVDPYGVAQPDALVKVYQDTPDGPLYVAQGRSNAAGAPVVLTVPAGKHRIYVDPLSNKYMDQWYGGGDGYNAPVVTIATTLTVTFILQLPVDFAAAEGRALPTFWKDTVTTTVYALYAGEEKAMFNDRSSPFYQHPLVGPFLTPAKAAAA